MTKLARIAHLATKGIFIICPVFEVLLLCVSLVSLAGFWGSTCLWCLTSRSRPLFHPCLPAALNTRPPSILRPGIIFHCKGLGGFLLEVTLKIASLFLCVRASLFWTWSWTRGFLQFYRHHMSGRHHPSSHLNDETPLWLR